jgi:hypothetical protein
MQKLVTIFLRTTSSCSNGKVETHLEDFLQHGWKVVSVTHVGSGGGDWLAVLLQK